MLRQSKSKSLQSAQPLLVGEPWVITSLRRSQGSDRTLFPSRVQLTPRRRCHSGKRRRVTPVACIFAYIQRRRVRESLVAHPSDCTPCFRRSLRLRRRFAPSSVTLWGLWGTSEPKSPLGVHLGEKVRVSRNLGIKFQCCRVSSKLGVYHVATLRAAVNV